MEEILKSGNLEFKTMMRRKTRRKGKTGRGEWDREKVSGAEKGEESEVWGKGGKKEKRKGWG